MDGPLGRAPAGLTAAVAAARTDSVEGPGVQVLGHVGVDEQVRRRELVARRGVCLDGQPTGRATDRTGLGIGGIGRAVGR